MTKASHSQLLRDKYPEANWYAQSIFLSWRIAAHLHHGPPKPTPQSKGHCHLGLGDQIPLQEKNPASIICR